MRCTVPPVLHFSLLSSQFWHEASTKMLIFMKTKTSPSYWFDTSIELWARTRLPFLFLMLSFRIVSFYNSAETHFPPGVHDSPANDTGNQSQVQFVCHSEHGVPKLFLLRVSPKAVIAVPHLLLEMHGVQFRFWIHFLDRGAWWCTTSEMHHGQSDGRDATLGGSLWVFVRFDSESSFNKMGMRVYDCDVTAQHDEDGSLE